MLRAPFVTDWPLWLLAAVDVLAVHRLTKLVTDDVLTVRPRWALIRWAYLQADHDPEILSGDLQAMVEADEIEDPCDVPKLAVLITCRWCCSIWTAVLAVAGHGLAPAVWFPVASVLALSSAATLLSGLED